MPIFENSELHYYSSGCKLSQWNSSYWNDPELPINSVFTVLWFIVIPLKSNNGNVTVLRHFLQVSDELFKVLGTL